MSHCFLNVTGVSHVLCFALLGSIYYILTVIDLLTRILKKELYQPELGTVTLWESCFSCIISAHFVKHGNHQTMSDCSCAFPVVCVCVLHHAELYLYVVGRFSWSFVWWRSVVSPRGREAERSSSPAFLLPLFTKPRPLPGNSLSKPAACSHNLCCLSWEHAVPFWFIHFLWFLVLTGLQNLRKVFFVGLVKIHTQHVSTPHMIRCSR